MAAVSSSSSFLLPQQSFIPLNSTAQQNCLVATGLDVTGVGPSASNSQQGQGGVLSPCDDSADGMSSKGKKRPMIPLGDVALRKKARTMVSNTDPISILNALLPGLEFKVSGILGPDHLPVFTMNVTIDGQTFEGRSSMKKKAKLEAAEKAVRFLIDEANAMTSVDVLDDNGSGGATTSSNQVVTFTGIEKYKDCLSELNLCLSPGMTFPQQLINELYQNVTYLFEKPANASSDDLYSATIRLEEMDFTGSGSNKKIAKMNAAVQAIKFLDKSGILERKMREKNPQKLQTPKTKPAFEQKNKGEGGGGGNTGNGGGGGGNAGSGGGGLDRRSEGKTWVRGGKIDQLPLILPENTSSYPGYEIDDVEMSDETIQQQL